MHFPGPILVTTFIKKKEEKSPLPFLSGKYVGASDVDGSDER